jgi:hypothetical protein
MVISAEQLKKIQEMLASDEGGLGYDLLDAAMISGTPQAMLDDLSDEDVKTLEAAGYKVILAEEADDTHWSVHEVSW